jgi:uncharacterized protein YcbK (DUF882 family)
MDKRLKIALLIAGAILSAYVVYKLFQKVKLLPNFSNAMTNFKYFDYKEFDSTAKFPEDNGKETWTAPDGRKKLTGSGKANIKTELVSKLDEARDIVQREWNDKGNASISFRINSGYRTPQYNATLSGAVPNSSHTLGMAADISVKNYSKAQVDMMLEALRRSGFTRFGLYDTFIHVDIDNANRPSPSVWGSGNHSNPFNLVPIA